MKNILRFAVVAAVFMGSTTMGSAQTGAVELKDGGGTFISSHNSITAANAVIPASISQGYIIELKNTYTGVNETFPIVFTARTGASVTNTITLRPASGVSSVTISDDATEIIELDDADYIIIDGRAGGTGTAKALKIENTATNNECITLSGGASYNTIRYCDIFNNSTTTAGRSIFITTSTGSTGNSYNLIEHCKIEGGRYGINLNGTTTNANVDNKIYGCEIFNNHFAGIWVQSGNEGVEIDSNEIYYTSTYQSNTSPYGMVFDSQTDTAIITRNKIYGIDVSGSGDIFGISVRSVSGTNLTYIVNNFISLTKSNGSFEVYGIDYGGSGVFNSQIYFNTIRIGGTQTNTSGTSGNIVSACIYKDATSTSADFDILNNILINDRTGGNSGVQHVALGVKNAAGNFNLDYNTYNSAGDLTRWDGTAYADITSHQAAVPTGNELNSNEATVDLVSATDLHIAGNSLGDFDLKALPLTNVLNDIDNDGRGATTYRGADDNPANPILGKRNEIGVESIDSPIAGSCGTTQDVKVTVRNFGINQVDTFTVNWSIDNVLQTPVISYAVLDTVLGTGSTSAQVSLGTFAATAGVLYDIKAWTSLPNNKIDPDKTNDSAQTKSKLGLAGGTYTIGGTTPDFATISEAFTELNNFGICGAVTFNIRTGTYVEQATLTQIAGASATNTITFTSETGVKTDVVISSPATTSAIDNHVLLFDGSDHIIIKDLTLERSGTGTFSTVISIDGEVENISIHDNIIRGPSNTSTNTNGSRSNIFGSTNATTKDVVIYNNQLEDNSNGIWLSTNTSTFSSGTKIYSNTITPNYGGIYVVGQYFPEIYKNTVTRIDQSINVDFYGISLNDIDSAYSVHQNQVSSNRGYGIRLRTCAGYSGKEGLVINNMVTMDYTGTSSVYGITSETRGSYQLFAHNTVLFNVDYSGTSTTLGGRAFYMPTGTSNVYSNIRILNNIFYNAIDGVAAWFVNNSIGGVTEMDYNLYYSGADLTYISGYLADLSAHQTTSNLDDNAYNFIPTFVANNNAHISFLQKFAFGKTGLNITEDFDGDPRCASLPTIGADEFNPGLGAPNSAFIGPDTLYTADRGYFLFDGNKNQIAIYKWYVNGVETNTGLNLIYTFPSTGNYDVKLVAENCGGKDSTIKTYTITNPTLAPKADFGVDKNEIFVNESVKLTDLSTNGPTLWTWSVTPNFSAFIDNPNAQDPEIFFSESGKYEVCLTAGNTIGNSTQLCRTAYVEVFPKADMCVTTTSTAKTGKIFDDGGELADYGSNRNCTYFINPCASEVNLKITDWTVTDVDDQLIIYDGNTTDPNNIIATITGGMTNPGGTTGFTAKSGRMTLEWITDAFTTNDGFAAEWTSKPVSTNPTVAGFNIPDTLFVNSPATFNNASTGAGLTYEWDFDYPNVEPDDNNSFAQNNPTKTFTSAGNYTVYLQSTNCAGKDTVTKTVVVVVPTVAPTPVDFEASLTKANAKEVIRLKDLSGNGPTSWKWEVTPSNGVVFLDPETSKNPRVLFNFGGTYAVKLIATNGVGTDSTEKTNYIEILDYCQPNVLNINSDITIRRVVFENIDQSSDFGVTSYSDFTGNNQIANVAVARTYPISIERNTNNETVNFGAWIDFNLDGDFTDPNERVLFDSATTSQILTGQITIPANVNIGETRLRVGVARTGLITKACGPVVVGEFEDYKVNIGGDDLAPIITLIGNPTPTIEAGYGFTDSGATAIDNVDGNITSKIVVKGAVDTLVTGEYIITYVITDTAGNTDSVQRKVTITPDVTKPLISLVGADTVKLSVFSPYVEDGITAIDNPFGTNLTGTEVVSGAVDTTKIGTYILTYTVVDASGNNASITRVVIVEDLTKPVITLIGNATIDHDAKTPFFDAGATVTDNYDVVINYTTTGTVDVNTLGANIIVYKAVDASGNIADSVVRTVNVVDRFAPTIKLVGNDIINLARWQNYTDEGYTLSDNFYDSVDVTVDVLGTWVNSLAEGSFYIQYRATDPSGNISFSEKRFIDVRGTNSLVDIKDKTTNVYPNPNNGSFVIENNTVFDAGTVITVTNVLGAKVFEVKPQQGNQKLSINLQGAAAGIYFVNVNNGKQTETTKIIVR